MYAVQETGTYYLRARYYDPTTGRFTQEDPHWNSANSIYGDTPMAAFQREDALGLTYTSYAPQIFAIQQSGNLYVYCVGNPVDFADPSGETVGLAILIGGIMSLASYVFTTLSTGEQINTWHAILAFASGAAFGGISAAFNLAPLVGALINAGISIVNSAFTGATLLETLVSAMIAAASGFVTTGLSSLVGYDDLAGIAISITAGGSVEAIGDMIEIGIDALTDNRAPAEIEDSVANETSEEIVDEVVESTDNDTPIEENNTQLPPQENIQPDPPENSGGSPSGPGDYIGPDKRPIAL